MAGSFRKYLKIIFRKLRIVILVLATIIMGIAVSLQFSVVQNYLAAIAVQKLSRRMHTQISIGRIRIMLPNRITIRDLYVGDQNQDTLINAGLIRVNVGLFGLMRGDINIRMLELHDVTGQILRSEGDSAFNFSFIPAAFASGAPAVPADTTSGSSARLTLGRVRLTGIRFIYNDSLTGNRINAVIGDLSVHFRKFSPNPLIMDIGRFDLQKSSVAFYLSGMSSGSSATSSNPGIYLNNTAKLSDVSFYMEDQSSGQKIRIRHADLTVRPGKVDLQNEVIRLKQVKLQHTVVSYIAGTTGKASPGTAEKVNTGNSWDIRADRLILIDNTFSYDVDTAYRSQGQVDFNHLQLRDLNADFRSISAGSGLYKATIHQLGFRERSGFNLTSISGRVLVSDTAIDLASLKIQTPGSLISGFATLHYDSIAGILKDALNTRFDISIENSRISPHDVEYFSPDLYSKIPAGVQQTGSVFLSAGLKGKLAGIDIERFELRAGDSLALSLSGKVKGLPSFEKARFSVKLDTLQAQREDILTLLPDTLIPSALHLPEYISLHGHFEGSVNDFSMGFNLHSSQGNALASLIYRKGRPDQREHYSGRINIQDYDVGKLLNKPDTLGEVSLNGQFSGSSRHFRDPDASFDLTVGRFTALNYTYHNLRLAGTFANHIFDGDAGIRDTSLVAHFTGKASFMDSVPSYDFTLNVEAMDAKAIHLTNQDIRLKGTVRTDFTGANVDSINGYLKAYDFLIVKDGQFYPLDSILISASNSPQSVALALKSQFINADYSGTVRMSDLTGVMKNFLGGYFDMYQDTAGMNMKRGSFDIKAEILNTDLLAKIFLPGLTNFDQSDIYGKFRRVKTFTVPFCRIPWDQLQGLCHGYPECEYKFR